MLVTAPVSFSERLSPPASWRTRREEPHNFHSDARFCAVAIFCDLCRNGVPRGLPGLLRLCEEHGARALPDPCLPARMGGYCDGENLVVSAHLSGRQFYETIPHELVHVLSHSPRWTCLNYHIEGWRYDRAAFLEAVARMVGKMFAAQYPPDTG